jgi:4-hydroxybenzoate polyprenyltransferase
MLKGCVQTIFALGTAPVCRSSPVENTLKAVFWLWSVLLQFNLINQTVLPEEDAENKPWRPIPAGRITLRNAIILRWISIPLCAMLSSYFGTATLVSCILFTFFASLYNFCDGDKNGFVKNLINGFGSCSLALGTTLVAGACFGSYYHRDLISNILTQRATLHLLPYRRLFTGRISQSSRSFSSSS